MKANAEQLVEVAAKAAELRADVEQQKSQLQEKQVVVSQLRTQLNEVTASDAAAGLDELAQQVREATAGEQELREQVDNANDDALAAEAKAKALRDEILDEMHDIVQDARLREDVLAAAIASSPVHSSTRRRRITA